MVFFSPADDNGEDNEEEKIAAAEWNWGKKIVMISNLWGKEVEECYDFDVTRTHDIQEHIRMKETRTRIKQGSFIRKNSA